MNKITQVIWTRQAREALKDIHSIKSIDINPSRWNSVVGDYFFGM